MDEGYSPTGLDRLARLLAMTKENAQAEISKLSSQVRALDIERQTLEATLEQTRDELGDANSLVSQLRLENTRKWRVEERDDWRALVDSMQMDRKTLQEENARLHGEMTRCITVLRAIFPSSSSSSSSMHLSRGTTAVDGGIKRDGDHAEDHSAVPQAGVSTEDIPELTRRSNTMTVTVVGPRGPKNASVDLEWLDTLAEEFDVHDLEEAGAGDEGGEVLALASLTNGGTIPRDAADIPTEQGAGPEECMRLRMELDASKREAEVARLAFQAQANEQDDELRILRANVARLESNGLHKCKAQPRTVRAERSAGSIVGVLRWWKPERSLSRSSSMAGIHGDITVV